VNDSNKMNALKKFGGWGRMVIFTGVIITIPLFVLLGAAIYGFIMDRPGAFAGILWTLIIILVFWAITWVGLWMVSDTGNQNIMQSDLVNRLNELARENERLQKLVTELSQKK